MSIVWAPQDANEYGFGDAFHRLKAQVDAATSRVAATRLRSELSRVAKRQDNWDGRGSSRPSEEAVARAAAEVAEFQRMAEACGLTWSVPHVGSNEFGEISFEWWRGGKKLTIYVGAADSQYVCSWGADINGTMDAGDLEHDQFANKWRWFRT